MRLTTLIEIVFILNDNLAYIFNDCNLIQMRFIAFDISTHNFLVFGMSIVPTSLYSVTSGTVLLSQCHGAKPTTLSSVAAQP